MKTSKILHELRAAVTASVLSLILCAVVYPAVVWGLGLFAFPNQAAGSLLYSRDRTVIGSELVAQPFASDIYFRPRPSAVDYKADATGGSNLGTKNPDLRAKMKERAEAIQASTADPAPAELVTASGSGLDPHITPAAAKYQAPRVAAARKISLERILALIDQHTETSGWFIGAPPRVNVLRLNLALDDEKPSLDVGSKEPSVRSDPDSGPSVDRSITPTASVSNSSFEPIRSQLDALTRQVARLDDQAGSAADSLKQSAETEETTRTGLKKIEEQVAALGETLGQVNKAADRLGGLSDRVNATSRLLQGLGDEVKSQQAALKSLSTSSRNGRPPR